MNAYDDDRIQSLRSVAGKSFKWGGGALGLLMLGTCSTSQIDETQRGLKYQFGQLVTTNTADVLGPGLNFQIPFVQSVKKFDISRQQINLEDVQTYTKDNQVITASLSYLYRIPQSNLVTLARENPDYAAKLQTAVIDSVKGALGQYDATAIALNRNAIMVQVTRTVSAKIKALYGIDVQDVQMTNFKFEEVFERGVETAAQAKNDQIRKRTELENARIDGERRIVDATSSGNARRLAADAAAYESQKIKEGEAAGFRVIAGAIGEARMGDYLYTQRWNGSVPAVQGGSTITDLRGTATAVGPHPR